MTPADEATFIALWERTSDVTSDVSSDRRTVWPLAVSAWRACDESA
jgi:hypothetical protein